MHDRHFVLSSLFYEITSSFTHVYILHYSTDTCMAWLVRSQRTNELALDNTPANIGPGRYDVATSSIRVYVYQPQFPVLG